MLIIGTLLSEALCFTRLLWRFRLLWVVAHVIAVSALSGVLFVTAPTLLSGLIVLLSCGRIFNYLRIAEARMNEHYLHRVTRRTSRYFGVIQLVLLGLFFWRPGVLDITWDNALVYVVGQLVIAAVLLVTTIRTLRRARYCNHTTYLTDRELPTLTVAIPARDETTDLEACLQSVIASDYPKLEIIVLDDCSHLRTPEIIKSFAHDGVRFIKGAPPADHWLAKNQAYERLAKEASGEIILFCGVDVRFGRGAIRAMVHSLQLSSLTMLSVLPRRLDGNPAAAFIQPIRYWWELALPRRSFDRPPVLSTAWMIRRAALADMGGFAAVSRSIVPESYFARDLYKKGEYAFLRAGDELDVQTLKSLVSQRETALRVRYPQIHRRPELALLLGVVELYVLLGPLAFVLWAGTMQQWLVAAVAAAAHVCLTVVHVIIVASTNPANVPMALINLPVAIVVEMIIGTVSMCKYEFSTVVWKGRNVAEPVMHVIPRLPKLE